MVQTLLVMLILGIVLMFIWGGPIFKEFRYRRIRSQFFPVSWQEVLEGKLPIYNRLPEFLQRKLQGHINVFLTEKQFIGCGGVQITDEIKLTIAAQACLLLMNDRGECYPSLDSILVYPRAFIVNQTAPVEDSYIEERKVILSGESWAKSGQVVLSWQQIKYDTVHWRDGHNVVLHEFAHQLDRAWGTPRGMPLLDSRSAYLNWSRILSQEYEGLRRQVERGFKTVIDEYGATDPAEFFAVATETFFEKPKQLRDRHPELFNILKSYYRLDPCEWF